MPESEYMKRVLFTVAISLFAMSIFGQSKARLADPLGEEIPEFKKEITFDIRLHTNGFAIAGNYGLIRSVKKSIVFQIELATIKHPREIRQSFDIFPGPLSTSPKAFIYGKQNAFYAFHFGYGGKRYFSQKAKKRGVAVGLTYTVGPSLGIAKPYFLDLIRFSDGMEDFEIVSERYSEENADLFLNLGTIYGASGFTHGLGELSFIPGGHAKVGLHLDWGAFDTFVKALDVGITIDAYHKKVPIMLTEDNKFLFVNLYISLQLGKRS